MQAKTACMRRAWKQCHKIPNIIFFLKSQREAIGICYFKDYNDYKQYDELLENKDITLLKILTKDIVQRRFSYIDAVKELLKD